MSSPKHNFAIKQTPTYIDHAHIKNQKLISLVSGALIVVAICGVLLASVSKATPNVVASMSESSVSAPAAIVAITSSGFSPATISIVPGQTVTWVNQDSRPHEPASDPYPLDNELAGFIDAAPLNDTDSYGFTFAKAGTYTYHDELNPFQYKGTVIVRP